MTSGPPHTLPAACLLSTAVKVSFRRITASGTAPCPLFPVTIRRCGMACAYAESSVGFPGVP